MPWLKDKNTHLNNSKKKLLPCYQCGSQPNDIEWGSVLEYCGIADHSADISCSGKLKSNCPVQVSISIDADDKNIFVNLDAKLSSCWNALNSKS